MPRHAQACPVRLGYLLTPGAGAVCCDQGHESCVGEMPQLPTTCTSQGCARAVGQTQVACREYLRDGMGAAMTNIMDPLYALCAGTTEPSSVAITDPQAQRTPLTCGAVISDGSGVHALSGTDTISVHAPAGNRVGITVEDLYLPSSQHLRVLSADGSVLAEIRGQEMPEQRTYMVRNGLPMATVQLVGADGGEKTPSMFRLRVTCVCVDDSTCGAHGSCGADGRCECAAGWGGDHCEKADTCAGFDAEHGSCAHGRITCTHGYSGAACEMPPAVRMVGATEYSTPPGPDGELVAPPLDLNIYELDGLYIREPTRQCNGRPVYKLGGTPGGATLYMPTDSELWRVSVNEGARSCEVRNLG